MTTLFNVFCPIVCFFKLTSSFKLFFFSTGLLCLIFLLVFSLDMFVSLSSLLFSLEFSSFVFLFVFKLLLMMNLISLVFSGFTVTTILSFNLFLSLLYWIGSVMFMFFSPQGFSSLLPSGSPLLLSPLLCVIELVSISVRPITLCFRLLANMCAGHVILGLIFKAEMGLWLLGLPLMSLEILVSFIQAFVFSMLLSVYFKEAVSH